jgi:hypothetical protein
MLTTIKGYYNGSTIIPQEHVPVAEGTKAIITFLSEDDAAPGRERIGGRMAGKMIISDDFDEPLEDLKDYM